MKEFVKISIERLKLVYQWVTKIFLAESHFRLPLWRKLWLNMQGYLVDQYVIYDFAHRDKREYLSEFDWYRSRRINGDYSFILNNKLVCADLLKQYTNTPATYVSRSGKAMMLADGRIASDKDVHLIGYREGGFTLDLEPVSEESLLNLLHKSKDWFLSEYVRQAEYLNHIYGKTANTIRMIALRDPKTLQFKLFFAVQRIGTSGTVPVDNGSRGGLIAKVDLDTGILSEARCLHNLDVHTVHPDSGNPIRGVKIPNWEQLKTQILDLSDKFPYLSFIAWDILATEEGFCVIEANTSSGVNIIQLWGGQKNGELGDFYRAHGIIK